MTARRVLVTGAAGFVGANLAARLIADGHEVHALLRPGSDLWRLTGIGDGLVRHHASLTDAEGVARVVSAVAPEWIFHLAAHGAHAWQDDRRRILDTNVNGTIALIDACAKVGFDAFVHAGSSSEYGAKDHAVSEDEPVEPASAYAFSKLAATLYGAFLARTDRVRVTTLRLYTVYGPLEEPGRLMPTLLVHALAGELPPLADPTSAHDFVYVDDAIDAFVRAAENPRAAGAVFNVASGVSTSLAALVETVQNLLGVDAPPRWHSFPPRPWDTATWAGDNRRIRERLGWEPRHSLRQGLGAMAEWLRAGDERRRRYDRGIDGRTGADRSS